MKNLKITLLALALALVSFSFAQKQSLHINYAIDIVGMPGEEGLGEMAAMFKDAQMSITYFKKKSRTEMNMGPMNTTTIFDEDAMRGISLMNTFGAKQAFVMSREDMEKAKQDSKELSEKINIRKTDKRKKILGYSCQQAIITVDGNEIEIWYCPKLQIEATMGDYQFEQLEGAPLQMSLQMQGMVMKMQASEVNENFSLPADFFSLEIPEGYTLSDKPLGEF